MLENYRNRNHGIMLLFHMENYAFQPIVIVFDHVLICAIKGPL